MCFQPKESGGEMNSGKFLDSFKASNLKFSEYEDDEGGLIPVTPPVVNKRKNIGNYNYNYNNKMNKYEKF